MSMDPYKIIDRPIITEEAQIQIAKANQYTFRVNPRATKGQIRAAVESAFSVKVTDVRTLVVRGKMKRMGRGYSKTQNWKKAIVTLKEGDKIAAFEPQE